MDLKNKTLEDWLKNPPKKYFSNGKKVDYYSDYTTLKNRLIDKHNQVVAGAGLHNPELKLNDHGPKHIETVIERATELVKNLRCELCAKEVYFLLVAIQIHDLGNMFGRYKHEEKAMKVVGDLFILIGFDTTEKIMIENIAKAHGGRTKKKNSKDRIVELREDSLDYKIGQIRSRLLASILRFADELADDKWRCDKDLLINNLLPKGSEVFHAYAYCLEPPIIRHDIKQIELEFKIRQDFVDKKFGKYNDDTKKSDFVYLIDEIYARVMKMHFERIYTMRYMRDHVNLDNILVRINFYDLAGGNVKYAPISFLLKESGYPTSNQNIFGLCPSLTKDGHDIDGEYIRNGGMNFKENIN
jgi:hypothetical protein